MTLSSKSRDAPGSQFLSPVIIKEKDTDPIFCFVCAVFDAFRSYLFVVVNSFFGD